MIHKCIICGKTGFGMELTLAYQAALTDRKRWVCVNRRACAQRDKRRRIRLARYL